MIYAQPNPEEAFTQTSPRLRPWRELAILGLLVMDLCWLAPWFRTLTPATYASPPLRVFLVFGLVLFSVNWSARLFNLANLRLDLRRLLLVVLVALFAWMSIHFLLGSQVQTVNQNWLQPPFVESDRGSGFIPDEFLVGLFVLILAWRGLGHAQEYIEPATVRRSFLIGLLMFLGYIFFNTIVTGETPGLFLYLFFLAGLLAMSTARISVVSSLRGGVRIPFDRSWFLGVVFGTAMLGFMASLIAWAFSDRLQILQLVGNLLIGLIGLLMVAAISPIIYLAQVIFQGSRLDPAIFQNFAKAVDDLRTTFAGLGGNFYELMDRLGVFEWGPVLKPFLLWSLLIVMALLVVGGMARWVLPEAETGGEERAALSGADLWRLFREGIQNRLRHLVDSLAGLAAARPGPAQLAAARIRRIYAQLMQLSGRLGKPRPLAITPLEFLPALKELFPGLEDELAAITKAYLRVRYGELPESQVELDQIESAWERVRLAGQQLVSQRERSARQGLLSRR
jgi:hypothetical protein